MTVNYNELFNFVYSTRIPNFLKGEVLNTVELPIQESIELPSYMYECVNFLDTLAYSDMSEELINEMIDRVFEGCSEEYLEEVYEAYVKVKAYEYITEGTAPIGLAGINREKEEREKAEKRAEARKEAIGKAVGDFKSKATEVGNKAKEGIKSAVGKVRDWYNKATQSRPIGLAKMTGYKAQNKPAEASKADTDSSKQLSFLTKSGKIAKKFQAKEPEAVRKIDTVKPEVKTETKPEVKAETKPEVKAETKPEEPKEETKPEEPKEETKPAAKLRPGQREGESLGAFRKRMREEGKVYNRKTKMYEPAKEEAKPEEPKVEAKPEVESTSKKAVDKLTGKNGEKKDPLNPEGKYLGNTYNDYSRKQENDSRVNFYKKTIQDLKKEIEAAEGKPSLMARMGELRKRLKENEKALDGLMAKK